MAVQCQLQQTSRAFPDVESGRVTRWYEDGGNCKGLVELEGCGCTRKVILQVPVFLSEGDAVECSDLVPDNRNPGKYIAREIEAVPEEEEYEQ
jgi:hypothetical protein